jgi:hypothetical protein
MIHTVGSKPESMVLAKPGGIQVELLNYGERKQAWYLMRDWYKQKQGEDS